MGTGAERQRRYRARQKAGLPATRVVYRSRPDRRSRAQRWRGAAGELVELQAEYQAWLDGLPDNLVDSPTGWRLAEICDLDLEEIEQVEPPQGFGRD